MTPTRDAVRLVSNTLTYPGTAAHELMHVAALIPITSGFDLELAPRESTARVHNIRFDADAPEWAIRLAFAAPLLVGVIGAGIVVGWLVVGAGSLPQSVHERALWLLAASWWLTFTWPSEADLAGALCVEETHNSEGYE